MAGLY